MPAPRCPTCKRDALPRKDNVSFPFCSPRCRAVDLGKWLGEEFRVKGRPPEEDEDGLPGTSGDGQTEEPQ